MFSLIKPCQWQTEMFIAEFSIRLQDIGEEEINEKYMCLAAKSRLNAQHFASGKENS